MIRTGRLGPAWEQREKGIALMKWLHMGVLVVTVGVLAGCQGDNAATNGGSTGAVEAPAGGAGSPESASAPAGGTDAAGGTAPAGPAKVAEKDYKVTASGLKYAILKPGTGPAAKHQPVFVHYTGWLQNGKMFDSSRTRGEPFEFVLGHGMVIPGWDEGVEGMKVGERRQLVVPPALGYGPSGTPDGTIPPNATLIFDVELIRLGEPHNH